MQTFFSGTDKDELLSNAGNYNYYLSLIVNFKHEYTAKIAYQALNTQDQIVYKTKHGDVTVNVSNNVVFTANCDIHTEVADNIPESTKTQIAMLKQKQFNKQQQQFNSYKSTGNIGFKPMETSKYFNTKTPELKTSTLKIPITEQNSIAFLKAYLSKNNPADRKNTLKQIITAREHEIKLFHKSDYNEFIDEVLDDPEISMRNFFNFSEIDPYYNDKVMSITKHILKVLDNMEQTPLTKQLYDGFEIVYGFLEEEIEESSQPTIIQNEFNFGDTF